MDKPESKRCPEIHPFYFPAPGSSGWSGRVLHHQLIQVVWIGRQQWSIKPVAGTRTPRDATLAGTPVHLRPDRLRACFFACGFSPAAGYSHHVSPLHGGWCINSVTTIIFCPHRAFSPLSVSPCISLLPRLQG